MDSGIIGFKFDQNGFDSWKTSLNSKLKFNVARFDRTKHHDTLGLVHETQQNLTHTTMVNFVFSKRDNVR